MSLTIRKAHLGDLHALAPLYATFIAQQLDHVPHVPRNPAFDETAWLRLRLKNPAYTTFVALRDGEAIATAECVAAFVPNRRPRINYAGLRPFLRSIAARLTPAAPTYAAERKLGEITMMYVDEPARGDGVGARLAAAVIAELERKEVEDIYLNVYANNATAIRFYESMGMRPESVLMRRVER